MLNFIAKENDHCEKLVAVNSHFLFFLLFTVYKEKYFVYILQSCLPMNVFVKYFVNFYFTYIFNIHSLVQRGAKRFSAQPKNPSPKILIFDHSVIFWEGVLLLLFFSPNIVD